MKNWVGVMGALVIDNGGEFSSDEMWEVPSILNIRLYTTGMSPFQNGLKYERVRAMRNMMLIIKLEAEIKGVAIESPLRWTNTSCSSLVVVLWLSIWEVVSSSPARAGRVKPKAYKIGSDCSFAKSTALRSENTGSFGYDLKNGGPVSQ
jgi:hypothetical protein